MADTPMDPHSVGLDALRRDINERFESVDRRFESVDRRFEAVDQRFDAVDQRFDAVEARLRTLIESVHADVRLILVHLVPALTRLEDHEKRIQRLERRRPS